MINKLSSAAENLTLKNHNTNFASADRSPEKDFKEILAAEDATNYKLADQINLQTEIPDKIGNRILTDIEKAVAADMRETFGIQYPENGQNLLSTVPWPLNGNIAENAEKAQNILSKHLRKWMINENISDKPPIELGYSSTGKVTVTGNHPQKEKIESFFENNSEVRNLYAGINSSKEMMVSFEESLKFQKRYAVDPKAAVEEFSYLFNGSFRAVASATISNGEINFRAHGMISIV